MAETLKISIDVNSNGSGGTAQTVAGTKSGRARENAEMFLIYSKAMSVAKQFGGTITNGLIGRVGVQTGNYALQERYQLTFDVAQKVVNTGVAFMLNPVLGGLSLINEGMSFAFNLERRLTEIAWQNRAASELARRAGYLSNKNR